MTLQASARIGYGLDTMQAMIGWIVDMTLAMTGQDPDCSINYD